MSEENVYKILIIDDEEDIANLVALHFKIKGFEVHSSLDGVSGIETAETERPDIILLDIMMPGIDGFEVCKRLKEKPVTAEIPIIFLTARTQAIDRVKGLMAGADDYVIKPFDFEEIELRIRRSIQHSKATHDELEVAMVDTEGMKTELDLWFNKGISFDLYCVELIYDNQKIIPLEVQKDFNLALLFTLREVKPSAYLLAKITPNEYFLFACTPNLELFAKLLIENFKKNALQEAYIKIKVRPRVSSSFHSSNDLMEALKNENS